MRYSVGHQAGKNAAASIFSSLSKDNKGKITEVIRIVSHSMGGAYAKGYAQALMEYILEHPDLTNGASLVEYDFAPFQPTLQKAVDGVETYQYSHKNDFWAGNEKMPDAYFMKTSDEEDKGHSIADFIKYIYSLPMGNYKVENGQFLKE